MKTIVLFGFVALMGDITSASPFWRFWRPRNEPSPLWRFSSPRNEASPFWSFSSPRNEVPLTPPASRCSSLAPPTTCNYSPCERRRSIGGCQGYPWADCQDDFCGGCHARYFYGDQEITPMCENSQTFSMFVN